VIRVRGLHKRFGAQPVLRGLDLDIATGEIMVIIGRSGGGKSVLLKHLIGLLRPDAGSVFVDATEITRLRGRELDRVRERYGVSSGARCSTPCPSSTTWPSRSEKTGWAARSGAWRSSTRSGWGMGHKNPAEISGGMRKRVAIARALVTEPEIVFFDEPTTGLDPILVNTIHHLIVELHRKFRFTGVMVSHEIPEIFEIADRVAVLDDGAIAEVGPPECAPPPTRSSSSSSAGRRWCLATALAGRTEWAFHTDLGVVPVLIGSSRRLMSVKLGRVDFLGNRGYVISADFPRGGPQGGVRHRDRGRRDRARGPDPAAGLPGARGHGDPAGREAAG
jgi:phospholipid/cholesterol/gamma-HCH transport system ATP-binding protein